MLRLGKRKSARRGVRVGLLAGAVVVALGIGGVNASGASAINCGGSAITGSGSSLQVNAQGVWTAGIKGLCSGVTKATYVKTSSGKALSNWGFNGAAFNNEQVNQFIGSDDGPSAIQIGKANIATGSGVAVIPVTQTAIGIVVHPPANCDIEEIGNKQLEEVFRGTLKRWGQLSTSVGGGCAGQNITRVVRPDGSGTTYQLKNYLQLINTATLSCVEGTKQWKDLEENGAGGLPNLIWPESVGPKGEALNGCAASALSPVVRNTETGGGGLVHEVNATVGSIGYAALPDIEFNKEESKNVHWVKVQTNGKGTGVVETAEPAEGNAANCSGTQYVVPTEGQKGVGSGINVDWSQVFGANPNIGGSSYPLCTLTFDIALTSYHTQFPGAGGLALEETVKAYLSEYITTEAGQEGSEIVNKFYAALPENPKAKRNVMGAAELAAGKIAF